MTVTRNPPARVAAAPAETSTPADRAPLPTVLLAIANSEARWTLRQHLSQQGFSVDATGDATIALDWLHRRPADVVVADVLLPGTRIAVPHVLRRRGRSHCPKLIGLTDQDTPCEAIRTALSYDLVLRTGTAAALIARQIHQLLRGEPPQT